ncbi:hypothetical protein PBL1C_65 [Paenibacillus phage PBL1c]|uniref:Uncharacterized protein n=1 Tax=Paenibacillus phage PBL1c TaxID=2070194 RepID=A0A2I7SCA3_9CAUD|nr:hypothetical protein HWB44_gp65 [Paenibacillus phage PBL1c]AUS03533.1 hypothetical protein PBL1C_65 [Paenibacillus phage PBL1c]
MTKHYWCEKCQSIVDKHHVTDGIHDECGHKTTTCVSTLRSEPENKEDNKLLKKFFKSMILRGREAKNG